MVRFVKEIGRNGFWTWNDRPEDCLRKLGRAHVADDGVTPGSTR